jgi:hypothetical protein
MKRKLIASIFALGLASAAVPLAAQSNAKTQTPSLGELARKLKAERKEEGKKPVAVYTNDNLPKNGSLDTVEVTGAAPSTAGRAEAAAAPTPASEKHGEAYFSKKAKAIRDDLNMHERELSVLKQKLSQSQMVYYQDPQKTLEQESGPKFQSDINKLRKEIADKQQQINSDHQAMEDLQQELRRDGGDPGWIR